MVDIYKINVFMALIIRFWQTFTHLGVNPQHEFNLKKRIILSNQLALITSCLFSILVGFAWIFSSKSGLRIELLGFSFLLLSTLWLNYQVYHQVSRFLLGIYLWLLFVPTIPIGMMLGCLVIPFILFNIRESLLYVLLILYLGGNLFLSLFEKSIGLDLALLGSNAYFADKTWLIGAIAIIGGFVFLQRLQEEYQKKLLAKVQNNRDQVHCILEQTQSILSISDLEGNITYISPNVTSLMGLTVEELGQFKVKDYVPEYFHETLEKELARALDDDSSDNLIEYPVKYKSGKISWRSARVQRIYDDFGNPKGIKSISIDIDKRKNFEEKLIQSEKTYRSLFEKIPNPLLIVRLEDSQIIHVNEQATHLYGYSYEEFTQLSVRDMHPPAQKAKAMQRVADTLDEYRSEHLGWTHSLKEGTEIYVNIYCHRFTYNDTLADLVLIIDVTEKVKTDQQIAELLKESQNLNKALQESEERFRVALDNFPATFAIYDPALRYQYISSFELKNGPYTREDFIGKTNEELFPSNLTDQYLPTLKKVAQTLKPQSLEMITPIDHTTGKQRKYLVTYIPMTHEDGSLREILCMSYNLSELKAAEEKAFFQGKVLKQISDIIILADLERKIISWNKTAEEIYGIPAHTAIGQRIDKIVDYEYLDTTQEAAAQETVEKGFWQGELAFTNCQGKRIYTLASVSLVKNVDNQSFGYISVKKDITKRKIAEKKLQESEARLQNAQRIAQIGSYEYKINKGNIYWSDVMFEIYGFDPKEGLQACDKAIDYVHPEERALLGEQMQKAFETATAPPKSLWRIRTAENTWKYIQEISNMVRDELGELKLVGTVQDVTEQKLFELENRKFSERLDLATQAAHLGIWDWNIIESHLVWDARTYEIFDISSDEPRNLLEVWNELIHPEDRSEVQDKFALFLENKLGEYNEIEYRIIRKNGEISYVRVRTKCITNTSNQVVRAVGVCWDITEIKKAEMKIHKLNEELEAKVKERTRELQFSNNRLQAEIQGHIKTETKLTLKTKLLEAANQELEAFSYSVSHDLMAPLRGINGYAEMLRRDIYDTLNEKGQRYLSRVIENSYKMEMFINDLLHYSRISRYELRLRKFDMQQLIEECLKEFKNNFNNAKPIKLQVNTLPHAYGDRTILRQVIMNLLGNALKFSRDRNPIIIHVGGRETSEANIYFIKDNGVGFDNRYVRKIFGVFQRLHTEQEFEGTGVGLAIVERIIRRHQGRIWAKGQKDSGACFYFSLPNQK